MDTPEHASAPTASNRKVMAILAYIGPLVIVSYLVAKDDSFVKFHIKQGLVLLTINVVLWVLGTFFWSFWALWRLIDLALLILAIIGIVNAANNHEKELPLVGSLARSFTF
jgi:uncharacterized membrane protein